MTDSRADTTEAPPENQPSTSRKRVVSGLSPESFVDENRNGFGKCDICGRTHNEVVLMDYAFGLQPTRFNWDTLKQEDTPNYLPVILCGTDRNLLIKIKKKFPKKTPREIIDLTLAYREYNPRRAKPQKKNNKTKIKEMSDLLKSGKLTEYLKSKGVK